MSSVGGVWTYSGTTQYQFKYHLTAVFEPAQLPQETICPSVAFAKGQIGNSRGQSIIYYNINTVFVLSNKLSFCCPRKNKTLLKQRCGCGKCKFSFIFTVCKFTLINQTETCCVIAQLNIHLSALYNQLTLLYMSALSNLLTCSYLSQ